MVLLAVTTKRKFADIFGSCKLGHDGLNLYFIDNPRKQLEHAMFMFLRVQDRARFFQTFRAFARSSCTAQIQSHLMSQYCFL
jgi:hypothetical protein